MGDDSGDSSLDSTIDSSEASDQESEADLPPVISSVASVAAAQSEEDTVPPGEENEVGTVVENRKRAIDRLLDKFEEVW